MADKSKKTNRCTLDVRELQLERFRLPRDGRKWRMAARNRCGLLLRLSTYANPDGSFMSEDGQINWSPKAETLEKHFAKMSMYRYMNDLQELGLLSWKRENHYSRRIYQIAVPEKTGTTFAENRYHIRSEHVPQLRTTSVLPSKPNPPVVPPAGGQTENSSSEESFLQRRSGEWIAVRMGKRKRIFSRSQWGAFDGLNAGDLVKRIRAEGFEARLVPAEEVNSWPARKTA